MSPSSPDDLRVSPAILARAFGIVPRHLQRLVKQGVLPSPTHGRYSLVETTRAFLRYRESGANQAASISLAEAQRQLTMQQIRKLAMANLERTGRLVPLDFVDQILAGALTAMRGAAETMPARHAGRFADALAQIIREGV